MCFFLEANFTEDPAGIGRSRYPGRTIENAEAEFEVVVDEPFTRYPTHRPICEEKEIEKAARLLEKTSSPVIVAGGGATASNAGPEIAALAEKLSIPVATSLNGKGTIPPLATGGRREDFSKGGELICSGGIKNMVFPL